MYSKELEKSRKELVLFIVYCIILFIIGFFIFILGHIKIINKEIDVDIIYIIILAFFPVALYYRKNKKVNEMYLKTYKDTIIRNFVKCINRSLNYHNNGDDYLAKNYLDAKFDDIEYNTFYTHDYIEGITKDHVSLDLCNFSLQDRNENDELLKTKYSGIFSFTMLDKSINNEVIIKKNRFLIKRRSKLVNLDSFEFEKYFDVYSSSNIIATEILTHDVMEDLVSFYKKYKIRFEIIIKNRKIHIRFDTGIMFAPNIFKKSNNLKTLWVYYNILNFVISLTIKLNKTLKKVEV